MIGENGQIMRGTTTASLSGGTFTVSDGKVSCGGIGWGFPPAPLPRSIPLQTQRRSGGAFSMLGAGNHHGPRFTFGRFIWAPAMARANQTQPALADSLRPLILALLPDGYPSVAQVARLSGLSLRSFQRELAEAGVTFSGLVEQARLELALAMMRDPAIRVTDMALERGYSESASFIRAFRRWTGLPPHRYRQFRL
jgi:AraC-like DNA-binding protein